MKIFLCIFLAFITFSCSRQFLMLQESSAPGERLSYCGLLNIPSRPYPAIEPRPYLGIYLASGKVERSDITCKENIFVQVAGVISGSPADKAGLRENDVILSLDETPTCGEGEEILPGFRKLIEQRKIGSVVTLDIVRDALEYSLPVSLEEIPVSHQPEAEHPEIAHCPDQTSVLENALAAQNALPTIERLLGELYRRSNTVHNPGLPHEKQFTPLQVKEVTYMMRHPLAAGEVARELSQQITAPLYESDWHIGHVMHRAASLLDISLHPSNVPAEVSFPALLRTMEETKDKVEKALRNLTPEEKVLLQSKAFKPWEDDQWNTVLEISMKVDRRELFNAFSPLLSFFTRDNLSLLKEDLIRRFGGNSGAIWYEAMTPVGKVIVGGPKPKVHTEDAALILDLGGDNLYLNNAGGTRPGMPVALAINWGGHNHYISSENFSQGAGLLGGGFLLDLGGNAVFVSRDGSQGAGFWGIGLLYHDDGDGVFSAQRFSQGTGQMGIGLLINGRGNDRYSCSYGGQGLGLFGGTGILIDKRGNDSYQLGGLEPDFRDPSKSTVSLGQGFGYGVRPEKGIKGVPGGIGMLIDGEGNDTYLADYFAQGAAYYYGLGILDDRDGDDRYVSGRYAQGAGIHSAVGVLIDEHGNDFYYASFGVAQGMGHDFGVGFFEDDQGEDHYQGGTLVQGAATNGSIGIFIGSQGKNRHTSTGKGQAYAEEESGMGIMIGRGHRATTPTVKLGVKESDIR